MGVTERKDKRFNEFWQEWSARRISKKLVAKHIFSEKGDYYDIFSKMKHTEAKFLKGLTTASVLSARLHAAKALGALTWWSVFVFGLLTALLQLGIAVSIINTLITGLIAMLAIAGGLAFGLGGKEYASYLVNRLREETGHHE